MIQYFIYYSNCQVTCVIQYIIRGWTNLKSYSKSESYLSCEYLCSFPWHYNDLIDRNKLVNWNFDMGLAQLQPQLVWLIFPCAVTKDLREAFQKKTTKFRTYVQIRSTLRTLYPNMDKKKFGQVLFCLPYLPTQKVWTFWNQSLLYFKFSS